jgi:hypothetical protein
LERFFHLLRCNQQANSQILGIGFFLNDFKTANGIQKSAGDGRVDAKEGPTRSREHFKDTPHLPCMAD